MRNATCLWLAAVVSLIYSSDIGAQPRVRLPAVGGNAETVESGPLGRPTFDPYGNSDAPDVPSPPAFGGGEEEAGNSGRSWFGFPRPDAEDGDSRRPLFTRSFLGGDDDGGLFSDGLREAAGQVRFRYTWLPGGHNVNSLDINDVDVALPIEIPDFLGSTQPWYFIPTFGLHLWDGPAATADLPGRAYSASVDTYFRSDPDQRLGVELGAGVGIYTDFKTLTFHSLRVTGRGLLHLRLTPDTVVKGGVWYLGRNHVRLLPAVGLLWTPNAQTRWDIFFPEPRLSQYLTTVNDMDVWWYLGGEYGGGSWTIKRSGDFSDRIDLNDVRLSVGLEWGPPEAMESGSRLGFVEAGLVFDREIRYVATPAEDFSPKNTVYLRVGIGY
jgi:hypothetical protein